MIVPCFNEANRFDLLVWRRIINEVQNCVWFFVNDGSQDRTIDLLLNLSEKNDNVEVIDLPSNGGKGEAIRAGFEAAIGKSHLHIWDSIGYLDADGAFDYLDISEIIDESNTYFGELDQFSVIIGSRVKLSGRNIKRNPMRHYFGRMITTYVCYGWQASPYDTQSGFKIFSCNTFLLDAVKDPFITSWFFDIELLLRLQRLGDCRIWEKPLKNWTEIRGGSIKPTTYFLVLKEMFQIKRIVKNSLMNKSF